MKLKLALRARSRLVIDVAGIAAGVERQMTAPFFRHIDTDPMTRQTEIAVLIAGGGL